MLKIKVQDSKKDIDNMNAKRLLTSCFGLGLSPFASGTCGSVLPCAIFLLIGMVFPNMLVAQISLAVLAVVFSWATLAFSKDVIARVGKEDPSEVVSDEFAGQAVTIIIASFFASFNAYPLTSLLIAFLLFRFFDITKIWPVCKLESLPGGLGILADDLFAGLYAGLVYFGMAHLGWIEFIGYILGWFADSVFHLAGPVGLGVVQGLTEFLPVSSSGHLVLIETIIPSMNPDSDEMLLFDLAIHVGTVLSILVIFRRDILLFLRGLFNVKISEGFNPVAIYKRNFAWHFGVCGAITTIVTMVLYKIFEEPLESARKLPIVCAMWFITAAFLYITDKKRKATVKLRDFGIVAAIIVGAAQSLAILPGISRSGATICAAILVGLHSRWAIQYSFLIAMPAILGGALLTALDNKELLGSGVLTTDVLVVGVLASFLTGILALKLLIFVSTKKKLKIFSIYCIIISVSSMIYLYVS